MKKRIYEIIFEADTPEGKFFDLALLATILVSIIVVVLDSVDQFHTQFHTLFSILEWAVTILFILEYLARIWVVDKPWKYIFSFYGLIDLFSLLPTLLGLFIGPGGSSLMVIRMLRFLRIFRVLKMSQYSRAGRMIIRAIGQSKEKLFVFILFVVSLATIIGTLMYLIEGEASGFKDIPTSIYWAIVTLTTVGYGDISPATGVGQFLSSVVMLLGYAIIAVPTGIVTAGVLKEKHRMNTQVCSKCLLDQHDDDAHYCKRCGDRL
ncbi:MAG: ion transporter [Bacteroidota bacterium]|nr:ion transporter [Bacteroidota bacterium]MDX5431559.1 ion transporter [Bacteroidota bacterium]MDX5470280.1 ion transporter [Bacteroidota bacterium]